MRLLDVDLYETRNIHFLACNLRVAHSSCWAHETAAAGAVPWDVSSRGVPYPGIAALPKGSLEHGDHLPLKQVRRAVHAGEASEQCAVCTTRACGGMFAGYERCAQTIAPREPQAWLPCADSAAAVTAEAAGGERSALRTPFRLCDAASMVVAERRLQRRPAVWDADYWNLRSEADVDTVVADSCSFCTPWVGGPSCCIWCSCSQDLSPTQRRGPEEHELCSRREQRYRVLVLVENAPSLESVP
jgi:hypothetical protein